MDFIFNADRVRKVVRLYIQGGYDENYSEFMDAYLALNEFEKNVFVSYLYFLKTETNYEN
jgi:hypothetical protein